MRWIFAAATLLALFGAATAHSPGFLFVALTTALVCSFIAVLLFAQARMEARSIAKPLDDQEAIGHLLAIAAEYDQLAEQMKRRSNNADSVN